MSKVKILEALKIHRDEEGNHIVTHHHTSHPPETHRFEGRNQAAGHILSHIDRLEPRGGLPRPEVEEQEASEPGRPASFDYGSTQVGEIQGRRK